MNQKSPTDILATALATLGPIGHFPKLPAHGITGFNYRRTMLFLPLQLGERIAVLIAILAVGTWACSHAEVVFNKKDPGCVIIDELFGQWLTLLFLPPCRFGSLHWPLAYSVFLTFFKPWPVKWAENAFPAALGS